MNKTHKGATLVEVLVAMTVFLIICGAIFTSVIGIGKIVVKQEQTLRIGYLLSDVERFYDEDATDGKTEWRENYLAYLGAPTEASAIFLDSNFTYDKSANGGLYILKFSDNTVTVFQGDTEIAARALGGQNDE